jgi:nanoRNase/pAp phosphatase (c-di-AMP/oligoRNAs hydrolase)
MADDNKQSDIGKEILVDMVRNMAVLAKSNEVLVQKIEDLTAAMDDSRERMEVLSETVGELSGYVGAALKIVEDSSEIGADRELKWEDLKKIIKEMKNEVESEEEEEEAER